MKTHNNFDPMDSCRDQAQALKQLRDSYLNVNNQVYSNEKHNDVNIEDQDELMDDVGDEDVNMVGIATSNEDETPIETIRLGASAAKNQTNNFRTSKRPLYNNA